MRSAGIEARRCPACDPVPRDDRADIGCLGRACRTMILASIGMTLFDIRRRTVPVSIGGRALDLGGRE
jgi:hypothetical protein